MNQPIATDPAIVPLYQHTKAREWGLALLAWERGNRRGYQFEDGKLRIFREGYYGLLSEVDTPADQARDVIEKLMIHVPIDGGARPAAAIPTPTITLDQQVEIFRIQYPDGFAGATWQRKRRGVEQAKRVRRHRTPAIADATERLAEAVLTERLAEGRPGEIIALMIDVLAATDLVTKTQLTTLRDLPAARHALVAQSVTDLLWSDDFRARFERAVSTVSLASGRAPSWPLLTALPALVAPTEHLHVVPSVIRRQAAYMAPRLALGATPEPRAYLRALDMVQRVRDVLDAAELAPADLWDVHDFMAETLAPKAAQLLRH